MAFSGLGQLVQNISNAVEGFVGLITGAKASKLYPSTTPPQVLTAIETTRGNWHKSLPYAFSVVNGGSSNLNSALNTLNEAFSTSNNKIGFSDFTLPINPNEITQDEEFAIAITPTQGGTAVNHSGNRYKDLVISGTTGIAPMRGAAGVDLNTGRANLQGNSLKAFSGYEVFMEFRNWLRAYYEFKKDPTNKSSALVFKNFKDGEFLIIEVPKFSMRRSANSPMLYNYTITARVLGTLSFKEQDKSWLQKLDDYTEQALNILTNAQGVLLGSQDILRQVGNTYNQVVLEPVRKLGLIYKALRGVKTTAADVSSFIANSTMSSADTFKLYAGLKTLVNNQKNTGSLNTALLPLVKENAFNSITPHANTTPSTFLSSLPGSSITATPISLFPAKTLTAVEQDQLDALSLPQSYFQDAKKAIQDFADNAGDLFNLGSTKYNSVFERTSTLNQNPTKTVTDDEYAVLAALDEVVTAMNVILSTNVFYKSTYNERIRSINNSFSDSPNLTAQPAVKEINLPGQTSLERLALEQLGNSSRWMEIVELNGLKPPFISQTPSDRSATIKVPGDKILIPTPLTNGFPNIPINDQNFLEQGLSEVQKNLGIDLKLTKDFDLLLTKSNDLAVVKAEENAAQAIIFKLALEKGDLIEHPDLGVGLVVGTKVQSLTEIQTSIVQTLSQDPRFDHIEKLSIRQLGGTFIINFTLWIKNVDMPIPLTIKV